MASESCQSWHVREEVAEMVCARRSGHTREAWRDCSQTGKIWRALELLIAKPFLLFFGPQEAKVLGTQHPGGTEENGPSSLSLSPLEAVAEPDSM